MEGLPSGVVKERSRLHAKAFTPCLTVSTICPYTVADAISNYECVSESCMIGWPTAL